MDTLIPIVTPCPLPLCIKGGFSSSVQGFLEYTRTLVYPHAVQIDAAFLERENAGQSECVSLFGVVLAWEPLPAHAGHLHCDIGTQQQRGARLILCTHVDTVPFMV